jgi:hypothetical protein
MAVSTTRTAVGTAAVQIAGASNMPQYVWVQNADYAGTTELFVGAAGVTTATGFRVWRDQTVAYELAPNDNLFAISSAAGGTAAVLRVTK